MHLALHGGQIRKMPLLAKTLDEVHGDVLAVDLAVEIEDQHLEQRVCAADGRARADARNTVERTGPDTGYARGENSVDRGLQSLQVHVCRREAELAPEPQAAHHAPRHRVLAPEHPTRRAEVSDLQCFADR